jgi:hypothetical protein
MKLINLIQEDFTNYKKPSLFLGFPKCSGKCNLIAGKIVCQNEELKNTKKIDVSIQEIIDLYINNPITKAIVCGGLEPFDTPEELLDLVESFRYYVNDDIVIYTGYTEPEVKNMLIYGHLLQYPNIIIKYGRFIAGQKLHYDEVLGVQLASNNQYARNIT